MKKFNLSLVALLAMSTLATAGGDIAPVEPVVETPIVEESTGSFYAGLGYSYMNLDPDNSDEAMVTQYFYWQGTTLTNILVWKVDIVDLPIVLRIQLSILNLCIQWVVLHFTDCLGTGR